MSAHGHLAWAGLAGLVLIACSSSATQGDGGSQPSAGKAIASLSDAELGALCDQLAATEGGYSHPKMLTCDAGTQTLSFGIGSNQAQCKQALGPLGASCGTLTVGNVQGCVTDTYAQTCSSSDLIAPSCDPFFSCLLGDASAP
jgi:hypothetical protein